MPSIKPVKKNNLMSQVMESIKNYIIENNLSAGTRLSSERQLAEEMGVSKTILREALKSLETVGILEIRGGDGIYVSDVDFPALAEHLSFAFLRNPHDIRHLAKTRLIFEVGAVEDVIENADEEDFARLSKICDKLEHAKSVAEHVASDREFHKELVAITHNPLLIELSAFFNEFFVQIRPGVVKNEFSANAGFHRDLIDVIKAKDVERAKVLLDQHIGWYKDAVDGKPQSSEHI